jgi:hypothetical protein
VLGDWGCEMQTATDLAKDVPLGLLRRYLILHGWRSPEKPPHGLELFLLSGAGSDIEVVLPKRSDAPDASRWTTAAIRSLAQLSGREIAEVLDDVRSVGADVLRSRLPDQLVRYDTVDLEMASSFLRNMRRLLAAAATTEINPERLFGRVKKEGKEYADHCRFGHTFKGSFGFTIESPIPRNDEPTISGIEQHPPFERRVIQRIVRGIRTVEIAAGREDPAEITSTYKTGFSANMCDDFAAIMELSSGSAISFELSLSPEWKVPPDVAQHARMEVRPDRVEVVKEAAKQLRKQEFDRNRVLVGRVTRLKSDQDPSDFLHPDGREITLMWDSPDLGPLNVRVVLEPHDYLLAVEAHRSGQLLSVSGRLDKIGRTWTLLEPSSVLILR